MCFAPGSTKTTASSAVTVGSVITAGLLGTNNVAYPISDCAAAPATGASHLVISAALVAATLVYAI